MWAKMAEAAQADDDASRAEFNQTKRTLALFFTQRVLPETALRLARVTAGADVMMSLPAEAF
jgi:hypothetical protein